MQSVKILWHKDIGISATKAAEGAYGRIFLGWNVMGWFVHDVNSPWGEIFMIRDVPGKRCLRGKASVLQIVTGRNAIELNV
jgi:hypothetical protein